MSDFAEGFRQSIAAIADAEGAPPATRSLFWSLRERLRLMDQGSPGVTVETLVLELAVTFTEFEHRIMALEAAVGKEPE